MRVDHSTPFGYSTNSYLFVIDLDLVSCFFKHFIRGHYSSGGSSGVRVSENKIDIVFGKKRLVKGGEANPRVPESSLHQYLKGKEIEITLHLHSGDKQAVVWTCDFSYDYIKINASYRT